MKFLAGLLVMAALCLSAMVAHAATKVEHLHSEVGEHCTDIILITLDNNCYKMLTRDCDDPNPCGWLDNGWHCDGTTMPPGGSGATIATFDGNGNLISTVAPGTGGVYSSGSNGNGICFAPDYSATLMISASIMGGLN
ncbi:MAG TPA: hypothetical protein VHI13_04510 [Candidatus Kapabacteria bacterium]|nr:hypothetical protein [Candidatus Kapabacteria bacterium]